MHLHVRPSYVDQSFLKKYFYHRSGSKLDLQWVYSYLGTIHIMYYSQMLLTRRIIFENLLTHWALDMIICSMYIPCVPWEVLSVNVLIAISTVNRPCKKLISHVRGGVWACRDGSILKRVTSMNTPRLLSQGINDWLTGIHCAELACVFYTRNHSWRLFDTLHIEPLYCCGHLACAFENSQLSSHRPHTSCFSLKWHKWI